MNRAMAAALAPSVAAARAETTRCLTLTGVRVLLALVAMLAVTPAALATARVSSDGREPGTLPDTLAFSVCLLVFAAIASVCAGADHRSGELVVGLTAVPSRTRLALARLLALSLVNGSCALLVFGIDRGIRLQTDPGAGRGGLPEHRVALGFLCATITVTVLAAALTTLLRHAMLSMAVVLLAPILVVPFLDRVLPSVAAALPFNASSVAVTGSGSTPMPWLVGVALLAGWGVAAVVTSVLHLRRRDL
ncbi:hypothetical protein [Cellulomonas triticagri]|uniref:Uncharacterized protein n=1 Tax=Cellulomonas triticagri TaxID=2483352 RepID=A0A3M2JJT5_9CELL|nr:hypothetical protein [Cellulomonas triticagri]RMI14062.1 hypothetical protein EBM89_01690 [Cellulomonas triticagri]